MTIDHYPLRHGSGHRLFGGTDLRNDTGRWCQVPWRMLVVSWPGVGSSMGSNHGSSHPVRLGAHPPGHHGESLPVTVPGDTFTSKYVHRYLRFGQSQSVHTWQGVHRVRCYATGSSPGNLRDHWVRHILIVPHPDQIFLSEATKRKSCHICKRSDPG